MDTITMYQTGQGWRWTRRNAENNLIIGASSQEYTRQDDCRHNVISTQKEPYNLIVDGAADPNEMVEIQQPAPEPTTAPSTVAPLDVVIHEIRDNRYGEKHPKGKP